MTYALSWHAKARLPPIGVNCKNELKAKIGHIGHFDFQLSLAIYPDDEFKTNNFDTSVFGGILNYIRLFKYLKCWVCDPIVSC